MAVGIGGKVCVQPGRATGMDGAVQLDSKTSSKGNLNDSLLSRAAFNASWFTGKNER